jgi:hypothetical protein
MIVVLGVIASLYGVYQIVVGYPAFELTWIENTDAYQSIAVYNVTRALATFNNAEEWGRYCEIGALIAFGLGISRREGKWRGIWFISAFVLCGMLALSGQRSSIFGLFLGLAVLFLTGAKSWANAFGRIVLLAIPLALFLGISSQISDDDIRDFDSSQGVSTMLSHSTKGTFNPSGEGSLDARLTTWTNLVTHDIPRNPLGTGLGDGTPAQIRTSDKEAPPIDNHFLSLAVSAGVPALLLLLWIFYRAGRIGITLWRRSQSDSVMCANMRIVLALLAAFILNNFFGTSFVIYSIAPIGWMLLGWISARGREQAV